LNSNIDKIDWFYLSSNPNAIHFIEKNINNKCISWCKLSKNKNAISILERNPENICWNCLCHNPNAKAINLIEKNMHKIFLLFLCFNPNAIYLLEKNIDKINSENHWDALSFNHNANDLLEQNIDCVNWDNISQTQKLHFLQKYKEQLNYEYLSENPNIFVIDYTKIDKRVNIFKENLMKKILHPRIVEKNLIKYDYLDC
jgi:hypothetical protein